MDTIQQENAEREKTPGRVTALMWREFVGNTTLHGLRYVFLKRPKWIRALWLLLILTAAGYYCCIVANAVMKFLQRPMNTVINTKYANKMDFPAVTICPLSPFSNRKLTLLDHEENFIKEGLNMKECAATAAVRGANNPCGLAFLCCCVRMDFFSKGQFTGCSESYRQQLISAIKEKNVVPDMREFFHRYGKQVHDILSPRPICFYGEAQTKCNSTDFEIELKDNGVCFTFNSGPKKPVEKARYHGITNGLTVLLDAQASDYTHGKYSQGFQVIVHNQGEYADESNGINIAPGLHATLITSRQEVVNLPAPYATNCKNRNLKQFPRYTTDGCMYECDAELQLDKCGCRPLGYQGDDAQDARTCNFLDMECVSKQRIAFDYSSCGCGVPCFLVHYRTTVSYSKFPDYAVINFLNGNGYGNMWNDEYQRTSLIFLQVGYASLSYQVQEQKAAYDSGALFGEIGGNMGLFLGCSLLTICEFVDFLTSVFISRRRRRVLAV